MLQLHAYRTSKNKHWCLGCLGAHLLSVFYRPRPLTLPTRSGGIMEPLDAMIRGATAAAAATAQPVRKTKLVATIGPASCSKKMLFKLADAGAAPASVGTLLT
jgi:hypothetical protein